MCVTTTTGSSKLGYDDLPELLTRLTGDEKHDWSALSTLDALWVLYDRVLRDGDRFLLSKGHGPAAYYAVLAAKGLISVELLDGFGEFDSPLGYHPDRNVAPGVEISSGSLGHGLAIAVGSALAGSIGGQAADARPETGPSPAGAGRRSTSCPTERRRRSATGSACRGAGGRRSTSGSRRSWRSAAV